MFEHTGPLADWTANITNVPTTNNRTIAVTLVVLQGTTAFMPTALEIDGVSQNIKYQGGITPSGTALGVDVVSFVLVRTGGSSWQALGSSTGYV